MMGGCEKMGLGDGEPVPERSRGVKIISSLIRVICEIRGRAGFI